MKSTRFPNKVLSQIPYGNGKPLIQWPIDFLKLSKYKNKIIVATSTNSENNVLEEYCFRNNITCFRGSEENVLSRFIEITEQYKFDIVVRFTADNTLIDIDTLDSALAYHIENQFDYTKTEGLPLGMNLEIMSASSLLYLKNKELTDFDREHVTPYIKNYSGFKKGVFKTDESCSEFRLTIDYPLDFLVVSQVLSQIITTPSKHRNVLSLLKTANINTPWLFNINKNLYQKRQFKNINQEIEVAIEVLKEYELVNASKILEQTKH